MTTAKKTLYFLASGGKDSYWLHALLYTLRFRLPISYPVYQGIFLVRWHDVAVGVTRLKDRTFPKSRTRAKKPLTQVDTVIRYPLVRKQTMLSRMARPDCSNTLRRYQKITKPKITMRIRTI